VLLASDSRGRPIAGAAWKADTLSMLLPTNTSQRDLVRLAVLVCGDRPSAKHRPAAKGV
jgi:hypothetical protein